DLAADRAELDSLFGGQPTGGRMQEQYGYTPARRTADELRANIEASKEVIANLTPTAQRLRASLDQGSLGGATSVIPEALGSVAGNPAQALPIVGGAVGGTVGLAFSPAGSGVGAAIGSVAGSVPLAKQAYEGAYYEAIDEFGAMPDEARGYAAAVTAVEFGTEALGGLGVGAAAKVGGLAFKGTTKKAIQEGLTQKIRSRAARTAGGALSEGLTELGANEGQ